MPRLKRTVAMAAALVGLAPTTAAYAYSPVSTESMTVALQAVPKQPVSTRRATSRSTQAPIVVSRPDEAHAGYVHYFVITGPDGEPESQVGIELPGERIAWSFPELGVVISPFITSGAITANGTIYAVEHLYGLRPFRDDAAMRALQRDLAERVAWWLDQKTPYCDEERPSNRLCLSCLGFVLRVLYPGSSPAVPVLPRDFNSTRRNFYTTEDLLMYLAGVRLEGSQEQRLSRIAALDVPDSMREQLVRIATTEHTTATSRDSARPRAASARPRSTGRSAVQSPKRALTHRRS